MRTNYYKNFKYLMDNSISFFVAVFLACIIIFAFTLVVAPWLFLIVAAVGVIGRILVGIIRGV